MTIAMTIPTIKEKRLFFDFSSGVSVSLLFMILPSSY